MMSGNPCEGVSVSNPARTKGTDAENKVVGYARTQGFPYADRLPLSGAKDRGDVRLSENIPVTIEVKGGQGALNKPHSHLRELVAEMANNGHRVGAVIAKKPGSTNVGDDWVAMMPVRVFLDIVNMLVNSRAIEY